jgi:hypothetical protein
MTSNGKIRLRADSGLLPWAKLSHPFVIRRRHFIYLVYVMRPKIKALKVGRGYHFALRTTVIRTHCTSPRALWKITSHSILLCSHAAVASPTFATRHHTEICMRFHPMNASAIEISIQRHRPLSHHHFTLTPLYNARPHPCY